MRSLRSIFTAGLATLVGTVALLALAGCGSSQPALPAFPEYPPAKVYLHEQDQRREQVQAAEAYETRMRSMNQVRAAQRADAMWRRTEILREQRELELAFRETVRRRYEQRHFRELQEFQSLQ